MTDQPQLDRWRFDGIVRVGRPKHLWGAPEIAAAIGCSEATVRRLEEREYTAMREDGLIGAEVYTALMQDLDARRAAAEERPHLDIALRRADLVRQFPLFAEIDDAVLKRLGRALETRYVNAGEVIIRKDSAARSVFFIASGAVELETAGQTWRLGRGEMFGQMAILMKKARRAEVRAIAPSTLLVLDEARFRRLLERSEALQDAVRASADKRGVDPDHLFEDRNVERPADDRASV